MVRTGAATIVMLTGPVADRMGLLASVALTVRLLVPAAVGVPLTRQFAPRASPAGRRARGDRAGTYGAVPPATPIVEL